MGKIEYRTLNERAYDEIKSSLIAGQFRPGQVLVIRTLADLYGISTTPVREALQRLVGERQLVMLHNRSIAVPEWDPAKFAELFRIRCALEGLAAELAATLLCPRDVEVLEHLLADIAIALRQKRFDTYVGLNQKFHFTIYEHACSPRLLEIIQNMWGQVGSYMNELFSRPGFEAHANDEHILIVKALKERNPAAAREHVVADITRAAEFLMPHVTELAAGPASADISRHGAAIPRDAP